MTFHPAWEGRIINLEGAYNFRDFGGYATQNGQMVLRGKFFRSAALSRLTAADHDAIRALNIRTIFDLRANNERRLRPTRLPEDFAIEIWSRQYDGSTGNLLAKMALAASAAESREMMLDTYRRLAFEQADSYREMFRRLDGGDQPVLIHCSAGKDRTGIAAALLLESLGVRREVVIADYLITERFFEQNLEIALHALGSKALQGVDPAIWAPLIRTDQAYLETMYEALEASHGSTDAFMQDVLGVTPAIRARLQARFCEPAP